MPCYRPYAHRGSPSERYTYPAYRCLLSGPWGYIHVLLFLGGKRWHITWYSISDIRKPNLNLGDDRYCEEEVYPQLIKAYPELLCSRWYAFWSSPDHNLFPNFGIWRSFFRPVVSDRDVQDVNRLSRRIWTHNPTPSWWKQTAFPFWTSWSRNRYLHGSCPWLLSCPVVASSTHRRICLSW